MKLTYVNYKIATNILIALLFCAFLILEANTALAATTAGGGLPFDTWFTTIQKSVTGPFAYGTAIIGLAAAGGGLIMGGELNGFMRSLILMTLVLSFLVFAQNTLTAITGAGAELSHLYSITSAVA